MNPFHLSRDAYDAEGNCRRIPILLPTSVVNQVLDTDRHGIVFVNQNATARGTIDLGIEYNGCTLIVEIIA